MISLPGTGHGPCPSIGPSPGGTTRLNTRWTSPGVSARRTMFWPFRGRRPGQASSTHRGNGTGWVAYVEVDDVDHTADLAVRLGGGILRAPFDVPGVGRNALLRDPKGAVIGIALSWHSFPVPERQFGAELYASDARPFPLDFYGPLFGWMPKGGQGDGQRLLTATDHHVATTVGVVPSAQWIPSVKVANPPEAVRKAALIGQVGDIHHVAETSCAGGRFIRDPDGTAIHLTRMAEDLASQRRLVVSSG